MKIMMTAVIFLSLFASMHFAAAAINQIGLKKSVSNYRSKYVIKIVNMTLIAFHLIVLVSYLGIEYSQVSFFLSSIFAVIGVALFANWSILSNITASLIIFFGFPYRVGDNIRIADKDDEISGIIEEISMFHVLIRRDDDLITYPNTLILQKAVIKRPSDTPFTSAKKVDKEQPPAAD